MGNVLIAFLLGLIPFSILSVLKRTFYALEDTRTPFLIQLVQAGLFVAGALVVATLPQESIAVGLAITISAAGTVQTLVTAAVLRRRLGGIDGRRVIRQLAVFLLACLPAAAAGMGFVSVLGAYTGGYAVSGILPAVLTMLVAGSLMLAIYLGVLALLRNGELRAVAGPIAGRLRGRR